MFGFMSGGDGIDDIGMLFSGLSIVTLLDSIESAKTKATL